MSRRGSIRRTQTNNGSRSSTAGAFFWGVAVTALIFEGKWFFSAGDGGVVAPRELFALTAATANDNRQSAHTQPTDGARTNNKRVETTTEWWQKPKPLLKDWPYLKDRNSIHPILEQLNFTKGAEIGVQRGLLARRTLQTWKSCKDYKLIDLWGKEENYNEPGADSNAIKSNHLTNAKRILKPYDGIVDWYVMRSTEAAPKMKDNYFDYIYVDARHDYCAVKEDIENYWPKLRPGGIMAGHDFVTATEAKAILGPLEDWSKCEDGTVNYRAVRGAVEDFAQAQNLEITLTHEGFNTWLIQKPYDKENIPVSS